MSGKVRCPDASTAASAPTAPKRARSDTIISVRRGKRSASAPPISTVVSIASRLADQDDAEPAGAGERERPPAERRQEGRVADQRHGLGRPDEPELAAAKREEGAERRVSKHSLRHGPKLSFERGRPIRVACVQMTSRADKAANLEKAERSRGARPPRPAPTSSCCRRSGTRSATHEQLLARRGAARGRRVGRGDARLGAGARDHARRRLDLRAPRGPREALEHVRRLRPGRRDRRRLPQDPPLRRRGRRLRLPRVGRRGARRRARGRARSRAGRSG